MHKGFKKATMLNKNQIKFFFNHPNEYMTLKCRTYTFYLRSYYKYFIDFVISKFLYRFSGRIRTFYLRKTEFTPLQICRLEICWWSVKPIAFWVILTNWSLLLHCLCWFHWSDSKTICLVNKTRRDLGSVCFDQHV
jgi:hypothetical protein